MLARYEIIIDPPGVAVELAQCKAPEPGIDYVLDKAAEPWRLYLVVYGRIRDAVTPELDLGALDGIAPLIDHRGKVRIHKYVSVQVVQFAAVAVIDILSRAHGYHYVGYVDAKALGLCNYYRCRASLSGHGAIATYGYGAGSLAGRFVFTSAHNDFVLLHV